MKHGIFIYEEGTNATVPKESSAALVVVGTAPVNLTDEPLVNTPVLATNATEAIAALGYSSDFSKYSLCCAMYVTKNLYPITPVVYINVLDPARHKKALTDTTVSVTDLTAIIAKEGVLKANLTVKAGETTLTENTDYTLTFDSNGYLNINLISTGAGAEALSLTVSGYRLDPSAVTKADIIGAVDVNTGAETGMEVIRQIYPKLGIVPGTLIAPYWSSIPEVGIALSAKAANINGVFKAMALVDVDATKYTDVKTTKESSGFTSEFCIPCWPAVQVGDTILPYSVVAAARTVYSDAENDDVPSRSPSNISLSITGTCLLDGTEIVLDQDQATTVGEFGCVTALNLSGFKMWGNHTGAYPSSSEAKDIWISVRRMFNWQGNNFILTYFDKVDDPMNPRLIENIVDSENIRCGAFTPEHWAGASIEYLKEDNPDTDILAGKITFRQHIAPYTPAETIVNVINYDTETLVGVLTGGE